MISEQLKFWSELRPSQVALVDGKREITFAELNSHSRKIATVLQQRGVKSGDLVCTVLPAYLDWPTCLAIYMLGAVSMAKLTSDIPDDEMKVDWLITTRSNPAFDSARTIEADQQFAELVNTAPELLEPVEFIDQSKIVRINSTSGTSGKKKFIGFNTKQLLEIVEAPFSGDFIGNSKFISTMGFGASQSYNGALRELVRGQTYFTFTGNDSSWVSMISKYDIDILYGSPSKISALVDSAITSGAKIREGFIFLLGGSTPTKNLVKKIQTNFACKVFNGYGSTETGFIAYSELDESDEGGLYVHPYGTIEIVNENDEALQAGEIGILRTKNARMAEFYINDEVATSKFFRDGFFYPGDMGYLDPKGKFFLTGRANEVLNLGGVKISPEQVDDLASTEPGVQDAAAFGLDDESGIPKLAIALVVDHEFNEESFLTSMKLKFPRAKIEKIFRLNAIPRNANGKILRRDLNQNVIN